MDPLVSIIIPAYNSAPWLGESLESALGQAWKNCEVIVVDDGSTDASLAIAQRYAGPAVQVVAKPNAGASSARNVGLRLAQGEFIQFLDADDLLDSRKVETQVARLREAPPDSIASGPWTRFSSSPPSDLTFRPEPNWRSFSGLEFLTLHYDEGWMMPPIAWLTPRSIVAAIGPWREDLSLNDDGEYFCRALLRSAGIVFCAEAKSYYRSGVPGSLSRRSDARSLQSLVRSIEANSANLARTSAAPEVRRALANAWMQLAYDIYPTLPAETEFAVRKVAEFGGANRRIQGGRLIQACFDLFGWRAAARLKLLQQRRARRG